MQAVSWTHFLVSPTVKAKTTQLNFSLSTTTIYSCGKTRGWSLESLFWLLKQNKAAINLP